MFFFFDGGVMFFLLSHLVIRDFPLMLHRLSISMVAPLSSEMLKGPSQTLNIRFVLQTEVDSDFSDSVRFFLS